MKKRTIALVTLVLAVVITGFAVSGTYAKYTSSAEFSDYARVAKWNIDFATSANFSKSVDLFKQQYTGVQSSGADDVIAPGAYGEYSFTLAATGTPEVKYNVSADVTVKDNIGKLKFAVVNSSSKALQADGVNEEAETFNAGTFKDYNLSADELAKVLKILLLGEETTSKDFNAGQGISLKAGTYVIHWMWEFENESSKDDENAKDTELGNGKTSDAAPKGNYEKDYTQNVSDNYEENAAAYVKVNLTATQKNS